MSHPSPAERRPCVLVPSYNNAGLVGPVVKAVIAAGLPVLVVDDGSTDGTGDEARAAGAEVVTHPINQGKGVALVTGWLAAAERGYSHAIVMDGDGQHPSAELPRFVTALRAEPDALIVGNRRKEQMPGHSVFGRSISDFMLWAAASHELGAVRPDSQCGFRLYPLAHVLSLGMRGTRYEFEMEVLVRAAWSGIPLRAIEVDVYYPAPEDRVSHFRKWRDNARIVGTYTRLMLMRLFWPLFRPREGVVLIEGS